MRAAGIVVALAAGDGEVSIAPHTFRQPVAWPGGLASILSAGIGLADGGCSELVPHSMRFVGMRSRGQLFSPGSDR